MTKPKTYHVCVECTPIHIDNCETCFGWGLKQGTTTPIIAAEVETLQECDPCPECYGDLKNEHLYQLEKESRSWVGKIKLELKTTSGKWVNISDDCR